ncbi:hypothetical protein QTP86_023743 [Hemibagrus guttatus]|nr:hypothetical protein QTP86_023743 [Hemibagrus guttatus]
MAKASASFGRLHQRLWKNHHVSMKVKGKIYRAVVISTLLYGAESWTVYRRHVKKLHAFMMRHLRSILKITWIDKMTNKEILDRTGLPSMEDLLIRKNLRWTGHLMRMPQDRLPKQILFSQLHVGHRKRGRPRLRYKDTIKRNLKQRNIKLESWAKLSKQRSEWRTAGGAGSLRLRLGVSVLREVARSLGRGKWWSAGEASLRSGDMEDSESNADDGLLATWRWSRNAREQVQLKQKIRDLPGLLKHGLHLRKKSQSPDTVPGPSAGVHTKSKQSCSQSFPCAGRALRNAFLSHGPYPAKDKIHLARIIRRSYVGVELVQWLLEQCMFVQCRMMAARVWQVLLELGILHSVDQRVVFEDSNTYYQFSFEECDAQGCEFRSEEEWQNGVRLLMQLVPYVQFRVVSPPEEDPEGKRDICGEILQMKALERLTSTVQNELAAALARKARKSSKINELSDGKQINECLLYGCVY